MRAAPLQKNAVRVVFAKAEDRSLARGCGAYATRAPQCYGEELTRVALNGILNELAEIRSIMEERSHETEETDVQHLRGI